MTAGVTTGIEGSSGPSQGGSGLNDLVNDSCVAEPFLQGGKIYGHTYTQNGWGVQPLALVLVKAGGKSTLSNLNGYFSINGLEVNKTYEVKASKFFYSTETFTVNLTPEEPNVEVDFILQLKKDITSAPDQAELRNMGGDGDG